MSKKGKKQKKKRLYNKKVFVNTICSACQLCGENPNPTFCYEIYRQNSAGFINNAFKRLRNLKSWPTELPQSYLDGGAGSLVPFVGSIAEPMRMTGHILFKSIFCTPKVCADADFDEDECPLLQDCIVEHRKQAYSSNIAGLVLSSALPLSQYPTPVKIENYKNKKKGRKAQKEKYVVKAYPTFFCKAESENEIKQILSN